MDWKNGFSRTEFSITTFCQAKCPLCVRTELINRIGQSHFDLKHMPLEDFINCINKLEALSTVRRVEICGDYGDPFLHPKIMEMLDYTIAQGFSIDVSTNGGLYSPSDFMKLGKQHGNKLTVCFSIDGFTKETFEKYRIGVDFDLAFKNMLAFNKANPEGAFWHFILFDYNVHEIDEVMTFAENNDLRLKFIINRRPWKHTLKSHEANKALKKIRSISSEVPVRY